MTMIFLESIDADGMVIKRSFTTVSIGVGEFTGGMNRELEGQDRHGQLGSRQMARNDDVPRQRTMRKGSGNSRTTR
jgi:hypothetical protein